MPRSDKPELAHPSGAAVEPPEPGNDGLQPHQKKEREARERDIPSQDSIVAESQQSQTSQTSLEDQDEPMVEPSTSEQAEEKTPAANPDEAAAQQPQEPAPTPSKNQIQHQHI
ncbi:hypothetical protein PF010_g6722 [Phytophthora fragariae]|uniref:Uncharacterized protein n=1 Tax=Phytophthora fragariae TaxID=53985 RepID=A0A6G0LKG1_9STRA|nr:hypothetical protein PF010_g6722 [Phytophthora fragariae]KAE9242932.1 hypothetical protein PF004_g6387 [Phytophthora fragariae]